MSDKDRNLRGKPDVAAPSVPVTPQLPPSSRELSHQELLGGIDDEIPQHKEKTKKQPEGETLDQFLERTKGSFDKIKNDKTIDEYTCRLLLKTNTETIIGAGIEAYRRVIENNEPMEDLKKEIETIENIDNYCKKLVGFGDLAELQEKQLKINGLTTELDNLRHQNAVDVENVKKLNEQLTRANYNLGNLTILSDFI